jgi:O-methyltransferase involved in polyketide biosynthesis
LARRSVDDVAAEVVKRVNERDGAGLHGLYGERMGAKFPTLDFVRSTSGKKSVVLFDYVIRSVLDGTCHPGGRAKRVRQVKRTSEPFVFRIRECEIEPFLSPRGFTAVRDVGADYLSDQYLRGERRTRYVKPWWRAVHAEVA